MAIIYDNRALRRQHLPQSGKDRKEVRHRLHQTTTADTIRLWTIQPPEVWQGLQEKGTLLVDPAHPEFAEGSDRYHIPYNWMREHMARHIPCYEGHYPWWAYTHFLDLRFYRWHIGLPGTTLLRLELAVPRAQVLLSDHSEWNAVLNRDYVTPSTEWDDHKRERDAWWDAVGYHNLRTQNPLPEPWEAKMRESWERILDMETRPRAIVQACFERLELAEVVQVTEFVSREPKPT